MSRRKMLTVVLLAVVAAGSACRAAPPSPAGSPAPAGPSGSPSVAPTVVVTEADSGKTVDLPVGARLEVFLHSSRSNMWSAITVDGAALRPVADGKLALAVGVTGAAYVAEVPGKAHLASNRRLCPSPSPGTVSCSAMQDFAVTVEVH